MCELSRCDAQGDIVFSNDALFDDSKSAQSALLHRLISAI